ncbi:hypothetical protein EYZ11_011768 [Aspergillus tanneri]|uniref:Nucleoside phosphorylase domain-containing protein n=1 Tax=Aspergillus tanneri TaxID=1220188 RepID=A0A4S3J1Y4_9EURO|nr:hypothetical protein EYZ11_011768 [Aspergillus tanneri]
MKAGGGNPYSTPVKLTDTLIWRIPEEFSWLCSFNYDKKSCGALIFGYNSIHGWYWAEIVEPSREPPEPQMSIFSKRKSSSPSEDSGIGKSLDSFTFLDGERVMGPSANFNANEEYFEPPRELPVTHTSCPERMSPCFIPGDYTVAIICALHKELMAVRILFDFTHENVSVPAADPNSYAFGLMGKLDIVATCLPDGEYGTSPAADVASNMKRSFCTIKFCLLVGIGGGVLSAQNDIRLGDVVSKPVGTSVVRPRVSKAPLRAYLEQIENCNKEYAYPGQSNDILWGKEHDVLCFEMEAAGIMNIFPSLIIRGIYHSLAEIFKIVKHFSTAFLLDLRLDKADVFVERRTSYHNGHNRLLTIFLRNVEYYEGILFLTTNGWLSSTR